MTYQNSQNPLNQAIDHALKVFENREYQKAYDLFINLEKHMPGNDYIKYSIASCCIFLGQDETAIKKYNEVLEINPEHEMAYFFLGEIYSKNNQINMAEQQYQKAVEINPRNVNAMNRLAILYNKSGNNKKSIEVLTNIIGIAGDNAVVYNNLALAYKSIGLLDKALGILQKAMEFKQTIYEVYYNAAQIYLSFGDKQSALDCLERSIELDPNQLQVLSEYKETLMKVCDWQRAEEVGGYMESIQPKIHDDFILSPMLDIQNNIDPDSNLRWAIKYTNARVGNIIQKYPRYKHTITPIDTATRKLKIAYLSSDIKEHPVAQLMRGVFNNQDKNNFEVTIYSSSKSDGSLYRKEIEAVCDRFIDVCETDDIKLAAMINNDKIDILIDLNGHTSDARLETLALKPAPIQINYIGFIGSMGADFIDYIITDKIVTPPEQQKFYLEKFAYMPHCYQANDNNLAISKYELNKADCGLPDDKFIFCSFNQPFKIEPVMFNVWMNILKRVPESVLWLYRGSIHKNDNLAVENIVKHVADSGVETSRVIFAMPKSLPEHLKRTALADLALDTRIYNGGAVTSQTLWAGVPVLTFQGRHFASRMASSIISAVGLTEMVTNSLEEYEDFAVRLATQPSELKQIRDKLSVNIHNMPLFDTKLFTHNLEKAYRMMWKNYVSGHPPKQLEVLES